MNSRKSVLACQLLAAVLALFLLSPVVMATPGIAITARVWSDHDKYGEVWNEVFPWNGTYCFTENKEYVLEFGAILTNPNTADDFHPGSYRSSISGTTLGIAGYIIDVTFPGDLISPIGEEIAGTTLWEAYLNYYVQGTYGNLFDKDATSNIAGNTAYTAGGTKTQTNVNIGTQVFFNRYFGTPDLSYYRFGVSGTEVGIFRGYIKTGSFSGSCTITAKPSGNSVVAFMDPAKMGNDLQVDLSTIVTNLNMFCVVSSEPVLIGKSPLKNKTDAYFSGFDISPVAVWSEAPANPTFGGVLGPNQQILSDVLELTQFGEGIFVIEMSYNPDLFADEAQAAIDGQIMIVSLDSEGKWVPTTDLNSVPGGHYTAFQAFDGAFSLGYWGVDINSNRVWAVVDHKGSFAVVPEPGTLSVVGLGALGLLRRNRKRG